MARRTTNFQLKMGMITISVGLYNANDRPLRFQTGVGEDGRKPKTIRVLRKDDEKSSVDSIHDIERIVEYSELNKYYQIDEQMIEIDASTIKKAINKPSETMDMISIVPMGYDILRLLDGSHYYLDLQEDKKAGRVAKQNLVIYTVLHEYLMENNYAMIVDYVSRDNQKYGVLYPDENGLIISNIIPSNLHRERGDEYVFLIEDDISQYKSGLTNMFKDNIEDEVYDDEITDHSHEKIIEIIQAKLAGEEVDEPQIEEEEDDGVGDMLALLQNNA